MIAKYRKLYICGFICQIYMTQGNGEFVTIALPKNIIERLDKCIDESNHLYTSRPHVVKIALARFFNENGKNCGEQ